MALTKLQGHWLSWTELLWSYSSQWIGFSKGKKGLVQSTCSWRVRARAQSASTWLKSAKGVLLLDEVRLGRDCSGSSSPSCSSPSSRRPCSASSWTVPAVTPALLKAIGFSSTLRLLSLLLSVLDPTSSGSFSIGGEGGGVSRFDVDRFDSEDGGGLRDCRKQTAGGDSEFERDDKRGKIRRPCPLSNRIGSDPVYISLSLSLVNQILWYVELTLEFQIRNHFFKFLAWVFLFLKRGKIKILWKSVHYLIIFMA